jgi:ubiquinone/menaquinone biosynthesis C-methylase UbiE
VNRTDYEQVAAVYDANPTRLQQARDDVIPTLTQSAGIAGLDVGCGTGNWLAAQVAAFAGGHISWHGLDPSPAVRLLSGNGCH